MIVSAAEEGFRGRGLKMDGEHKTQIIEAIESSDYETWKELTGDKGRIGEVITEENFSQFIQLHNLKKEGKLLITEWKKIKVPIGPPLENRLSIEEAKSYAEKTGLQFQKELEAGPYHYALIFVKNED